MQCANNLKQMGLAVHNYHDTFRSFPFGARCTDTTCCARMGFNWKTAILGFLEQSNVSKQLNYNQGAYFAPGWTGNTVLSGLYVPVYNCPSNRHDPFKDYDRGESANIRQMKHDYAGIAGVYPDPADREAGTCYQGSRGWVCRNGVLPMNETKGMQQVTDGTSQTILAGEQSGVVGVIENGKIVKYPIRANYTGGWAGCYNTMTADQVKSSDPIYYMGLTTVRWALNAPTATTNSSDYSYMANTILNSFHPGVVQVVLVDGSTRALSETIDMKTFQRLCAADDGQPVGGEF